MPIIITNAKGQEVLAKDVSSSKQTRKAFAYVDMADHTQQTIIITIR